MDIIILGIESSCDDTSAAIIRNGFVVSNKVANQNVHIEYGGVVPELASRAHQQNIIPVVESAVKSANIDKKQITAVAYTRGPGLMGALLVGTSFAKGFSLSNNIPMIDVNHLHGHILSLFLRQENDNTQLPPFPFLCLLVSGGHTQIMVIKDYLEFDILGQTIDDAAGEAFDKCAKVMGLPYPGGPLVDKFAKEGNENAFLFSKPNIPGLNYSFSGLKTSFLYFLRDKLKENPEFVEENKFDICASLQKTIISILLEKLVKASAQTGISNIAIAGGVSANSGLRTALIETGKLKKWNVFIPEMKYSTDNAAMIGITGYFKYLKNEFANHSDTPFARVKG
jgi:N6-L-threonylcarbamoyladenine synthase